MEGQAAVKFSSQAHFPSGNFIPEPQESTEQKDSDKYIHAGLFLQWFCLFFEPDTHPALSYGA